MRSYDFNRQLDWKLFQTLACEVVQQRERIQLQTFREGRDGGVDGLWFEEGQNIILQAKHYKQFSKLYQELEKSELQKKGIHSLTKRSAICKKEKECVTVFLWQEENEKYLRETGVYSALEHYLQRLKEHVEREGDS